MRLGALLGPITDPTDTRFLAEQARIYAGEGFASLWSAQAVGRGFMITDPLITLSIAATVADDVEIGTAVLQLPLYHPMDLAHRIFSLQQVCGDRLIFGVGAGSTEQDFKAYDRDHASRFKAFNESVAALRKIFATGGLGDADLSPWPAVRGGPPMFLGTWGKGVERAAREFDGWIASGAYRTVDEVAAAAERFHVAGGGRSIVSTLQLTAETDLGQLKGRFQRFAEAGFDDAVVMFMPGAPSPAAVRSLVRA
jgi:alkanesulfonate monooxygenase SsuD/methylene tetrahydromethanopterin reductase-like flavin-dependent oxidoreductase (luciferase family)